MNNNFEAQAEMYNFTEKFWFVFLMYFCVIMVLAVAGVYYIADDDRAESIEHIKEDSLSQIKILDIKIHNMFDTVKSDLLFLPKLEKMLLSKDLSDIADKDGIANVFLDFLKNKKIYDQVRYIDKSGMEVVRVNYNNGNPKIVNSEDLQDKSSRYYFKETLAMESERIYMSPMDLNIENSEIELPLKPMVRLGVPVYQAGEINGVIILNYLADNVLSLIRDSSNLLGGDFYLVDKDGYWLSNPDSSKEWGFMYKERNEYKFSAEFPKIWSQIMNARFMQKKVGDIIISYSTIKPLNYVSESAKSPIWFLINIVDLSKYNLSHEQFYHNIVKYLLICALLVCILAVIMAYVTIQRNKYANALKQLSRCDHLTKVNNRGELFEYLDSIIADSHNHKFDYALMCIDLVGLCEINFSKGYKTGDMVLQLVAETLKNLDINSSFVARIDGDKFALVLTQIPDSVFCVNTANRLLASLNELFTIKDGIIRVAVNIGIVIGHPGDYENADELLVKSEKLLLEVLNSREKIKLDEVVSTNDLS